MSILGKPRERTSSSARKVTPPSPTYMSGDQFSSYLSSLRNHRVARPGGARPLPVGCGSARRECDRYSACLPRSSVELPSNASILSAAASTTVAPAAPVSRPAASIAPSTSRVSVGGPSIAASVSSRYSTISGRGRDYYPDKRSSGIRSIPPPLRPNEVVPTDTYIERGQRWMEKEEAVSIRHALEDMDLKASKEKAEVAKDTTHNDTTTTTAKPADDDTRLYNAALNEAAELVWQHQHGVKPPEPGTPYSYKSHLRENSYAYARTASVGRYGDDIEPSGLARDPSSRSVSGSSSSSTEDGSATRQRHSRYSCGVSSGRPSLDQPHDGASSTDSVHASASAGNMRYKTYTGLAAGPRPMGGGRPPLSFNNNAAGTGARRRSSLKRNISGEIEKPFSGDQIYEEPETSSSGSLPRKDGPTDKDSAVVLQAAAEKTNTNIHSNNTRGSMDNPPVNKIVSRYEIHRNPPSQSRNPQYTTNVPQRKKDKELTGADVSGNNSNSNSNSSGNGSGSGSSSNGVGSSGIGSGSGSGSSTAAADVPRKNGVEIRSEDIRQATTMKLKDRNPKLPTPSFVSDNPGRPIVSFDANWKHEEEKKEQENALPILGDEAATDAQPGEAAPPSRRQRPFNPSPFARNRRTAATTSSSVSSVAPARAAVPSASQQQSQSYQQSQQPQQPQKPPQTFHRDQPPAIHISGTGGGGGSSGGGGSGSIPSIAVSTADEPPRRADPFRRPMPMPIPTIAVDEAPRTLPSKPTTTTAAPHIPTIVLPGDDDDKYSSNNNRNGKSTPAVPSIQVNDVSSSKPSSRPAVPTIVTPDSRPAPATSSPTRNSSGSRRPLPMPGGVASRPRSHWSRAPGPVPPSVSTPLSSAASMFGVTRPTAMCHECGGPIEGRFVALAGASSRERFHPECFRCHACGTSLEALEISPEPSEAREARLRRGQETGDPADLDERLRFFCHLDWHELFAPRCHHCTTPIVGEHVVALGHHWHVGHFFCAECGDPFGPGATHIEKDGYAWCVACQTRRTERRAPRCRACGTAVLGAYVRALGAEWHDECFRCGVCQGGFADGQVFPREGRAGLMQVVCRECRERELKA